MRSLLPLLLIPLLALAAATPLRSPLDDLEREASTVRDASRAAKLRQRVARLLDTPAGRAEAERCLALLWRLPREGSPPKPPAFPFAAKQAKAYQSAYARWAGLPVEVSGGDALVQVLVPPGTFRMGSPPDEPGRSNDEAPVS